MTSTIFCHDLQKFPLKKSDTIHHDVSEIFRRFPTWAPSIMMFTFLIWFDEHQTSDHSPGTLRGPRSGEEHGGTGSEVFLNVSLSALSSCLRRQLAPLNSQATMSTFACHMMVRTASKMFRAMLRFLAKVFWQCNDIVVKWCLPFLGVGRNRALEIPSRTICLLSRDVDRLDLDITLEGVPVKQDSAPNKVSHVKLSRDVVMLKVFH